MTYPDVTDRQKILAERYRDFIADTGGNEVEDLLQRIQGPGGANLSQTNIIVWAMAFDVKGQISLLDRLESSGKLGVAS